MADKEFGDGQKVRVSDRETKGHPPDRYTPEGNEPKKREGLRLFPPESPPHQDDQKTPESVKSHRSHQSRASKFSNASSLTRKMKQLEFEVEESLADAEAKLEAKKAERMKQEILEKSQQQLQQQLRQIEEENEMKEFVRLKRLSEKRLALELSKVQEDVDTYLSDESQDLGSDDEANRKSRTGGSYKSTTSASPSMQQWLNNQKNPNVKTSTPFTNPTQPPHTQESTTAALEKPPPDRIDRFLVRQTMGKDLPIFSGEPEEWLGFEEEYNRSTEMCGFSNGENLNRLRKALKGRAKETVQAMMIVPDNVKQVMATLRLNFGNPNIIIKSLIEKARKAPSPKDGKFETIISYSNTVRNMASTMEALKSPKHLNNPTLLEELVDKLPDNFRLKWAEKIQQIEKADDTANIKDFADWVVEQAELIMKIYSPKPIEKEEKKPAGRKQEFNRRKETVCTTDVAGSAEAEPEKNESKNARTDSNFCGFCDNKGHSVVKCWKFGKESVDDRWKWAKGKRVCYVCLALGHRSEKCSKKTNCQAEGCDKPYHPLLHLHKNSSEKSDSKKKNPETTTESVSQTIHKAKFTSAVLLRVVKVRLTGPRGSLITYALLDDASTVTMMDSAVAKEIGALGPRNPLRIKWATGIYDTDSGSRQVSLTIKGVTEDQSFNLDNVRTMKNLALPKQTTDMNELSSRFHHLKNLDIESLNDVKPTILIGQRHYHLMVPRKVVEGDEDAPIATRTKLGWTVSGSPKKEESGATHPSLHIQHDEELDELHQMVKDSFRTEAFGVKIIEDKILSLEDRRVKELTEATTKRVGQRFETGLLWRKDHTVLPESKSVALKRLTSVEKQMDKDKNLATQYCQRMEEYLSKKYARRLTEHEASEEGPCTWYLPHFMVEHPNKPGKLRLVFDAASKSKGTSLNDTLLKGADLLNSLTGILCKFRQRRIGFSADIKEMFHQVNIRKEDVTAQRFFWRGLDRKRPPEVMQMDVMIFGAVSSPYSAQEVKNRNAKEFEAEFPEAVQAIVYRHYMDDYVDSAHTVEEAQNLIKQVIEVHSRGGFVIRNFICSSKDVLAGIPSEFLANDPKNLDLESEMPMERVLGLYWDPNEDVFTFRTKFQRIDEEIMSGSRLPTKREVLRVVMSVYDPLGFLGLFIIKAKILLQDIWQSKIGWDDEIPYELSENWEMWLEELGTIHSLKIPRSYAPRMAEAQNVQLHIFCDASKQAFAAVAYVRTKIEDEVQTALVLAKTRVAPLKPMSIPRLELQAAVMGSRIAETLKGEHEIEFNDTYFWSDSRTVLSWIESDARRFKPFVAHRIGEIEELTGLVNWRWVPTKLNVADEATRSGKRSEFGPDSRWVNGPDFLKLDPMNWPSVPPREEPNHHEDELRGEFIAVIHQGSYPHLPDIIRFSKWQRLIRSTAWMIRFIAKCRIKRNDTEAKFGSELTVKELSEAEVLWLKQSQLDSFGEEIRRLEKGLPIQKSSRISQLSPTILDGKIVVRGRNQMTPIILDPKHLYTQLVVKYYHEKAGHHGQEKIVNDLRQKFWVIDMRTAVKRAKNACQVCRIQRAKPHVPEMAALPLVRLTQPPRPFWFTGLDYFGPMTVAIGRRIEKRYGALFTCLSTRAVHIEIAATLSTDSAIMAIRRFISRRGSPKEIHSDNGTNFRGAEVELRKALAELDQDRITAELVTHGTDWYFIPPSAPHMGGCWERMVQSVKTALRTTLKERNPREEVLQTLMAEAEYTVNSRPLTHVSVDPEDLSSLTPNDILIGPLHSGQVPGEFTETDLCLRKQWRISQRLADNFWKRWVREYLPSLARREKWHKKVVPLTVGDLVFIADGNLPRNSWPRGRVTKVYPGKDGQVRVVDVETTTGLLKRPAVKVCRIDVEPKLVDIPVGSSTEGGMSSTGTTAQPGDHKQTLGDEVPIEGTGDGATNCPQQRHGQWSTETSRKKSGEQTRKEKKGIVQEGRRERKRGTVTQTNRLSTDVPRT